MKKIWKRMAIAVGVFLIAGLIHFISSGIVWGLLAAIAFAVLAILIEQLLKTKKKNFFYALLGLIAGYFAGKYLYVLLDSFLFSNLDFRDGLLPGILEPYFELLFAYLGFVIPLNAPMGMPAGLMVGGSEALEGGKTDLKLLDTSVIIDGRISDISETGFLSGTLIVPKFVLNEIQALADSQDSIRRSRARRGLDVLNHLKEIDDVDLKISSRDYLDVKGVDAKLIRLGKDLGASIMTNDYNLNKVARLEGIRILNMNDLANALKPILLPGEEFQLDVLKEGKEQGQGVGYLADGTMVVVANGVKYIGKKITVKVTSILQTSAGRIIFTDPKK